MDSTNAEIKYNKDEPLSADNMALNVIELMKTQSFVKWKRLNSKDTITIPTPSDINDPFSFYIPKLSKTGGVEVLKPNKKGLTENWICLSVRIKFLLVIGWVILIDM